MNFLQKIEAAIQSGFKSVETWIGEGFAFLKGKVGPAVVAAVSVIQDAEASGILDAIATELSPITGGLSAEINSAIKAGLPTALAVGLGIEALPDNPAASDIAAFESRVVSAVSKNAGVNGTWQTNVAAQIYGLIVNVIASNAGSAAEGTLTFAQIVSIVEQAFQLVEKAKTAAVAAVAA